MKVICFNEIPGGDATIEIVEVSDIIYEFDEPSTGFYTKKDLFWTLKAKMKKVAICTLYRKRDILKYIYKLIKEVEFDKDINPR